MAPDEFQQAWQAQSSQTRIMVDPDQLRKQVQRNQRDFRATILRRDVIEVGVGVLLLPWWIYKGLTGSLPWTWWLTVPAILWVIGYFLIDRIRYPQKPSEPDASMLQCVRNSLGQVEHQIWLLRNVFWWYLLPFTISILTFFAHNAWLMADSWLGALGIATPFFAFLIGLYAFIDYLNQRAVRDDLVPRRDELRVLLASFRTGETAPQHAARTEEGTVTSSGVLRRWLLVAAACPLLLGLVGFASGSPTESKDGPGRRDPAAGSVYALKSPFSAVRWQEAQPEVEVAGEWFALVSLDGVSADEIVAFSRRTYGTEWQKRFEEDLVELLSRMGHPPGDTVKLVVRSLNSQQTQVLEEVPMTRENRRKIKMAALAREAKTRARGDEKRTIDRNDAASDRFWEWFTIATSGLFTVLVFALVLGSLGVFRPSYAGDAKNDGPAGPALASQVAALRKEKSLVGLAAMVMVDGQLVAVAADGERKQGSGKSVELGDQWHVGSITKSITATMIARLVESGQMQWTDTIGESFPDAQVHEDYDPVTLRQLLTHTAGAPANFPIQVRLRQPALGDECTRARRDAVLEVLAQEPAHPPGEKCAYSNVGYTIAGAMAEQATGVRWEDLVQREVFEPLQLAEAGFGPPKSPDETLQQPRGHRQVLLGWKIAVDDKADNTPIMGPAGTVHMTLADLCTYASEHLRGELGEGRLLSGETYKRLHTPDLDDYACGWVVKEPTDTIPHRLYWHNGSNTMWYALVVFIPGKRMTVAVASNDGSISKAESAAWELVESAAGEFRTEGDAALRKTLPGETSPKRSPFAAVRWKNFQPEVRVGEDWFQLVSIDGVTAGDIVTFSRQQHADKWQKRFEEDLVEVLIRMGHPPKDTVELVVCPVGSSKTRTLKDVPMTEANRRAIRAAAADR